MCLLDPHMCLGCVEVGGLRTGQVQGAGSIPRKAGDGGAAKAEGLVQMSWGTKASHMGFMGLHVGRPVTGQRASGPTITLLALHTTSR